ncbi:hypothetical protein NMG60_11035368 [Bertholletia excelsa]
MPSKLKRAIGAVKDQTSISLAKVNNSSSLEVAVLKATTHDDQMPVDERYIREILHLVSSDKSLAASAARAISKRIGRTRNWVVAVKCLNLVLRIFQDGDPYFPREVLHAMKRGAKILNLSNFRDDSNSSPWDYTAFVRTFALYLDERLDCFLTGKLQRRYTHRQRECLHGRTRLQNEPVHDMKPAMLLDKLMYWQRLLDRAVATRPTGPARTNRLVQICLYAVVQESFDLYKDISDGLSLLLDSFFHLPYNCCVNAFQACVKASKQFEELSSFYDLCKSIGVGRTSEYPSVQKISEELMETLQEFLKDQSSFPATSRSPGKPPRPLLPSSARRVGSFNHSQFSDMSSESGMRSRTTSLEELISATELSTGQPSISIDLEAYSIADQFEQQSQRSESFSVKSDVRSTVSLPIMSSLVDLLSFDELPEPEPKQEQMREDERQQGHGWELALVETATTSTMAFDNGFDPFGIHEDKQKKSDWGSGEGWEIVLAESAKPLAEQPINLYGQSLTASEHYYNPFLQDTTELTTVPANFETAVQGALPATFNNFSAAPTFQATPTFCLQAPSSTSTSREKEYDPFASYTTTSVGGEQVLGGGSMNQQSLFQEQQLWLQQQNKIISRQTSLL